MNIVSAVSKMAVAAPRGSIAYNNFVSRDSVYFDPFKVESKNLNTAPKRNNYKEEEEFEFLDADEKNQ